MTDNSETKAVKRHSGSPEESEKLNPEDGVVVEGKGALEKNVGLVSAVALIVGTMIGKFAGTPGSSS